MYPAQARGAAHNQKMTVCERHSRSHITQSLTHRTVMCSVQSRWCCSAVVAVASADAVTAVAAVNGAVRANSDQVLSTARSKSWNAEPSRSSCGRPLAGTVPPSPEACPSCTNRGDRLNGMEENEERGRTGRPKENPESKVFKFSSCR